MYKILEEKINSLRNTIFNMLNYANMYVIVLDDKMIIRYANNSLAKDLGYKSYDEIIGKCWLDFLVKDEKKVITMIHKIVADGGDEWEKYKEYKNYIQPINGNEKILVHWFNSHINTDYNWSFSFGISKQPKATLVSMDSIRTYYRDIVEKDRTMIESMRDMILFKNKIQDACEPENLLLKNEKSISV